MNASCRRSNFFICIFVKNYDSEKVYPMTPSKTFSKIAGVPYDPLQNFLQNGHFVPYDPVPYDPLVLYQITVLAKNKVRESNPLQVHLLFHTLNLKQNNS